MANREAWLILLIVALLLPRPASSRGNEHNECNWATPTLPALSFPAVTNAIRAGREREVITTSAVRSLASSSSPGQAKKGR